MRCYDFKTGKQMWEYPDNFVGVQGQYPIACRLVDGRVLLCGKTLPWLDENFSVERAGDFDGTVGREGINDDEFVGPPHALERSWEIVFFVEGDDDDGQRHKQMVIG